MTERKKKLIEVGLPLETINRESAREKSRKVGKPQQIHHWWARRPITTARAVLFAQLVDDPSAHPELFPTQAAQDAERARLHELIEAMMPWDNAAPDAQGILLPSLGRTVSARELFAMATEEIRKSNGGTLPAILDPFAGGGTIPLEAQRLGLEAHASDLNPVAVLINKALIEIPPKFAGRSPVHPDAPEPVGGWPRATGLAEDVRYYGQWMRDEAHRRIGHLYPKVKDAGGVERTVIAWIWARTVKSPNPANPIEVPLVRSWWLAKKKGKEAWVKASVVDGRVQYTVMHDANGPTGDADGTVGRTGAVSIADGTPISLEYVREDARAGRMGAHLIAVVAEGGRERLYLSPSDDQRAAAEVTRPDDAPDQLLPEAALGFRVQNYGMTRWSDLFTNRQLVAMTTFSDLVAEARERVLADALASEQDADPGARLEDGGTGPAAYADAVAMGLAFAVSRLSDWSNSLCGWEKVGQVSQQLFKMQAISMTWDYSEANVVGNSSGSFAAAVAYVANAWALNPAAGSGVVVQADASRRNYGGIVVSTDPPYYDNVGYADLADFFYVWLRRGLTSILPSVVQTLLTPKNDELVANPFRQDGQIEADSFFVHGFNAVFHHIREAYTEAQLVTVYYAYKQQDAGDDGTSSTGWTTLLDGLVRAGWEITATWPVRTEGATRMRSLDSNALASSIVLACRPRPEDAPVTTRRSFLLTLKQELPGALRAMMQGAVAPVDLAQAAIGPGMSIFSRYSGVREADGSDMSVRDALLLINATLDEVIDEQEADFDPDTSFCVKWYRQFAWGTQPFGLADQLSRSSGTSVEALVRGGVFEAKGGKARLRAPSELGAAWDPATDDRVSVWEATVRLAAILGQQGQDQVAALLPAVGARVALDQVKELGFLLYHEAERRRDARDALLFNSLVKSWSDIGDQARRAAAHRPRAAQETLGF